MEVETVEIINYAVGRNPLSIQVCFNLHLLALYQAVCVAS